MNLIITFKNYEESSVGYEDIEIDQKDLTAEEKKALNAILEKRLKKN